MPNNKEINYIGRVLDREKQAPISGAKVSLNFLDTSLVVFSDLEGIYKFKVKFGGNNILEGKITIEANGYKTFNSLIVLLPNKRDIGDIRLVYPNAVEIIYPKSESSSNLLLIIAAIIVGLALIVAALTIPQPQETPVKTRNNRINIRERGVVTGELDVPSPWELRAIKNSLKK